MDSSITTSMHNVIGFDEVSSHDYGDPDTSRGYVNLRAVDKFDGKMMITLHCEDITLANELAAAVSGVMRRRQEAADKLEGLEAAE